MSEQRKEPPKPIAPGFPVTSNGQVISEPVTPNWQEIIYTPERKAMLERGEMNLRDYHAISQPEMMQMALVGFRMFENGKYADAETLFTALISLEPTQPYFFTALGAVYLAQDILDGAKINFDHAITLNPKEINALVNRGEVHLKLGNIAEAAADFKAAIELDPSGKEPAVQRARVLARVTLETIEAQKGARADKQPKAVAAKPAVKKSDPAKKAAPAKKK